MPTATQTASVDRSHAPSIKRGPCFSPHRLLRSPHLQSALATTRIRLLPLRLSGGLRSLDRAVERVVDCGDGVRLQAFHSAQPPPHANGGAGLVVLLHGWQGSASSTYMLTTSEYLFRAGYDVVRLNLRDHGGTESLNAGVFHACLLDEVAAAVRSLARAIPHRALHLVGFSLGGNFALRLARSATAEGLHLDQVIAVNPPLNPRSALEAIDGYPLYRRYFANQWKETLARKQKAFPELYDFRRERDLHRVVALTEAIVMEYTPFRTMEEYFGGYDLRYDELASLRVPTTVITSEDDPIIEVEDFRALNRSPALRVEIHPRGGHCGYIEGPTLRPWLEQLILETVAQRAA